MANTEMLLELKAWARMEWERSMMGLASEWDQSVWSQHRSCGTVFCLAGKAALLDGWAPQLGDGITSTIVFMKEGSRAYADEIAQGVLGLTDAEADNLFVSTNSIEDVEKLIDEIVLAQ